MLKSLFSPKDVLLFSSRHNLRRTFCQAATVCWNCQLTQGGNDQIFCSNCKSIQKPSVMNYFDIFQLNQQHNIDQSELIKKFRNLQSSIHPDKFSGKSETEQEISAEWSSLVNKAYKILSSSLERGEYLLELNGTTIPEQNTIADPEFLMDMMERNEQVETATPEELEKLLSNIRDEMNHISNSFASSLQSGNLDEAKTHLIKIKYLTSIENSIKGKLVER